MRRSVVSVLLAAGVVLGALWLADSGEDVGDEKEPRAILGRAWFDRYPEKSTDDVHLWFWFGGGVGIHDHGSRWRSTIDVFEFERSGARVDMRSFHDKKRTVSGFRIERCDEKPPFDLCLTLDEVPSGPRKLYGFDDDEDLAERIPWAESARRASEERARAPRP